MATSRREFLKAAGALCLGVNTFGATAAVSRDENPNRTLLIVDEAKGAEDEVDKVYKGQWVRVVRITPRRTWIGTVPVIFPNV